ncbi:hypothetical protein L2E82_10070 [Cichorium intybus]|uniref:Uncharacterized protein n=1 Tax=Cichorium intybus TaxID=13427 RepID=A0ACB9G9E5_CICIN|nr:hypothetical protein L2E82_10070 [Cichorium intybus]
MTAPPQQPLHPHQRTTGFLSTFTTTAPPPLLTISIFIIFELYNTIVVAFSASSITLFVISLYRSRKSKPHEVVLNLRKKFAVEDGFNMDVVLFPIEFEFNFLLQLLQDQWLDWLQRIARFLGIGSGKKESYFTL